MRNVILAAAVMGRLDELEAFLRDELKLSKEAAARRMDRVGERLHSLSTPANYALCRFRPWRELGYRCISIEGWVFAYEGLEEGVVVRDMSHGKLLADVT
ncbi:MAG: hypothetical protein LBV38_06830 [Alistipes sp.]|jgi:hypothetical protein|nr:hypothetical protein [Alistipes sp.]